MFYCLHAHINICGNAEKPCCRFFMFRCTGSSSATLTFADFRRKSFDFGAPTYIIIITVIKLTIIVINLTIWKGSKR